jgi:hypothetical protein
MRPEWWILMYNLDYELGYHGVFYVFNSRLRQKFLFLINASRLNVGPPGLLFSVVLGSLSVGRCDQNVELTIHLHEVLG